MKKFILIISALFLTVWATAQTQTQQGYVKTKGRMVNGKLVPGQGLRGATVFIQGRTSVLVDTDNGAFSFPIPNSHFRIDSVQKKGYQLVDMDALSKTYKPSTNPIYIVMETPDQQLQDQLDSERRIRRTLQHRLEEREDEIELLKAQNKLSQEEYRQAIQQLYADQENNEKLISSMAKEYSRMDFDQLNELNQRINDAILNGRLTEADSLLRSKGNISNRIAEIRMEQQAEAQVETQLNQAKAGTQKKIEDVAEDCQQFFDRFLLDMEFDSAAVYIELRANLDTTNVEWQKDAASFFRRQSQLQEAEIYARRTVFLYRQLVQSSPGTYEVDLAEALSDLSILLFNTKRFSESESVTKEAFSICKQISNTSASYIKAQVVSLELYRNLFSVYLSTNRGEEFKTVFADELLGVFTLLSQLFNENKEGFTDLYDSMITSTMSLIHNVFEYLLKEKDYEQCEEICTQLVSICQMAADQIGEGYELLYAGALGDIAAYYSETNQLEKAEKSLIDALSIIRQQAKNNPQGNERFLAECLFNLGRLYFINQQFDKSEAPLTEAFEIWRHMAENNPYLFECYYKEIYALCCHWLGQIKINQDAYAEAVPYLEEKLRATRELKSQKPALHEDYFSTLLQLSLIYGVLNDYSSAYQINQEFLPLLKQKYLSDKTTFGQVYSTILANQAFYCILASDFVNAEQLAREAVSINPSEHMPNTNLAAALLFQGKYDEAEQIYRQFKDELKDGFLQDFNDFEVAGIIPEERKADVERIRKMLME